MTLCNETHRNCLHLIYIYLCDPKGRDKLHNGASTRPLSLLESTWHVESFIVSVYLLATIEVLVDMLQIFIVFTTVAPAAALYMHCISMTSQPITP